MSNFIQATEYEMYMLQSLNTLNYKNFLRDNTSQNRIWSSLLPRSSKKDSKEIYFIFF
jgi:hypothetical protein